MTSNQLLLAKVKGQYINQSDHVSAQQETLKSHLNKHGKHLKDLIKSNNVPISKLKPCCGKTLTIILIEIIDNLWIV